MTRFITHRFDITGQAGAIPGALSIAAWIFAPDQLDTTQVVPVLMCLPGGSYTKAYYHMEIPGYPGYSFAEYIAARGFVVIAIDHLGVGESTHPNDGNALTAYAVAQANHSVVQQVREQLATGDLITGVKITNLFTIAVGHSMGAFLTVLQQSQHESFDAIAPLGWTSGQLDTRTDVDPTEDGEVPSTQEQLDTLLTTENTPPGYVIADRRVASALFYGAYVPEAVIAADAAMATHTPMGIPSTYAEPNVTLEAAARIVVPMFLGNADLDVAQDFYSEPQFYRQSRDITIFRLHDSAHCHNFAPTRALLWERLAAWAKSIVASYGTNCATA